MEKRVDKTTENDLMKQVKSYVFDGRFDKALDIIEQMDVNRIRIAPSLCLSEKYICARRCMRMRRMYF